MVIGQTGLIATVGSAVSISDERWQPNTELTQIVKHR